MVKYILILCAILLASCQQRMFGVDETTWSTLSEKEREQVIDGYNKRKEMELANERHRQEVEAQTAPFYAAADAISSICSSKGEVTGACRLQEVVKTRGGQRVTIAGTEFEVSSLTRMSDAWLKGQKVQVSKNDELLYSVKIHNLDNGEIVKAKAKRGQAL